MKKIIFFLLAGIIVTGFLSTRAPAAQEIKETLILSGYLGEIYKFNKKIFKYSYNMQQEAKPFGNPRHRARFRFEPKPDDPRTIMILARKINARFKLIKGLLYHADFPDRTLTFRQTNETAENMITYSKRSLRAIKDNNYALYLASAQGIEEEAILMNELLASIEGAINASIEESDAMKESL
jgi:hypothetical protein